MRTGTYLLSALCAAGSAMAHMEMQWPYAIRSKFNPANTDGNIDYSNTSPLEASGSNFPCKGYHEDDFNAVTSYDAGSQYNITVVGSATHSGGSCQISLSYDNGKTFKAIHSYMGGCPLKADWDFEIPASAPSGDALLSWSWFNLVGNREMYQNCAFVTINGASEEEGGIDSLPDMFAANVGGNCTSVEGENVIFPNPGEKVSYDAGASPESPVSPKCGAKSARHSARRHARSFAL